MWCDVFTPIGLSELSLPHGFILSISRVQTWFHRHRTVIRITHCYGICRLMGSPLPPQFTSLPVGTCIISSIQLYADKSQNSFLCSMIDCCSKTRAIGLKGTRVTMHVSPVPCGCLSDGPNWNLYLCKAFCLQCRLRHLSRVGDPLIDPK
jgi:hypothetical protein